MKNPYKDIADAMISSQRVDVSNELEEVSAEEFYSCISKTNQEITKIDSCDWVYPNGELFGRSIQKYTKNHPIKYLIDRGRFEQLIKRRK